MAQGKKPEKPLVLTGQQEHLLAVSAEHLGSFVVGEAWEQANRLAALDEDKINPENAARKIMELIHSRDGSASSEAIGWLLFNVSNPRDPAFDHVELVLATLVACGLLAQLQTKKGKEEYRIIPPFKPEAAPRQDTPAPTWNRMRDPWLEYRQPKEPVDPRRAEEQALLAEIRSIQPRGRRTKRRR